MKPSTAPPRPKNKSIGKSVESISGDKKYSVRVVNEIIKIEKINSFTLTTSPHNLINVFFIYTISLCIMFFIIQHFLKKRLENEYKKNHSKLLSQSLYILSKNLVIYIIAFLILTCIQYYFVL